MTPVAPTLSLRVDIDTFHGCREGVPRLARTLDALGVPGSFFVVAGRDTVGQHLRRIAQPGYLRRLQSVGAWAVLRHLRWRSLLYGTILPGPRVAQGNAALLRGLARAGHEVGLHGDDHALWADREHALSRDEVRAYWRRAGSLFADALGFDARSAAAPNWRASDVALEVFDEGAMRYRSDTRGAGAFRPRVGVRTLCTVQLPVNLPTVHELLATRGGTPADAARAVVERLDPAVPNVWNLHDWFEGLCAPELVRAVVDAARARGFRVVTLAAVREATDARAVPAAAVMRAAVAGGIGTVSCRAPDRP